MGWINEYEPGTGNSIAYITGGLQHHVFSTRLTSSDLYVVCEFPCQRSSGDHIANVSAAGIVTCDLGFECFETERVCSAGNKIPACIATFPWTGYTYCAETGAVLQRTTDLFNFTTARGLCQSKGGVLLTPAAYRAGCTADLLSSRRVGWINEYKPGAGNSIAYVTGGLQHHAFSTRLTSFDSYVVCEFPCQRSSGDHIANVSAAGIVTCDLGCEHFETERVCSAGNKIPACIPYTCPIPPVADATVVIVPGSATYTCNKAGLMLVGDARPWCQANGSLTSVPSCVRKY
ncbi:uncharacterized protein LOC135827691 [Sycon ciliatum]|uniref:uncharacterized protein LOC135827691 n=1 Tax=Sycon ciliatum TaxID=27933 RepID=UPI0031F6C6B7